MTEVSTFDLPHERETGLVFLRDVWKREKKITKKRKACQTFTKKLYNKVGRRDFIFPLLRKMKEMKRPEGSYFLFQGHPYLTLYRYYVTKRMFLEVFVLNGRGGGECNIMPSLIFNFAP